MTRWEYKSYIFEAGDNVLDKMNQLGLEGWEAFHFPPPATSQRARVLFKRPIAPAEEPPK